MKLLAENLGKVTLSPQHVVASGGEGTVYAQGSNAFKIYHDQRDLADKILLLQQFALPGIVAPRGALRDEQGRFVGYWMRRVSGESLPNLFANGWRQDNAFGLPQTIATAEGMREIVSHAHAKGAMLVDANEFNWIVDVGGQKPQPMVLDIDSWQIGGHKATAIMASIRDWSATAFTENTDWFSWGVVTFQLFSGIHPFKGTHPKFGKGQIEARMRANASVFDAGVRFSSAVRDFQEIPKGLLEWYRAVFQNGVRSAPPAQFGVATSPSSRTAMADAGDAKISIIRLHGSHSVRQPIPTVAPQLRHDRLLRLGGRIFAIVRDSDRGLVELDSNGHITALWPVIANSTTFYRTGALSYYFGQPYILAVGEEVNIFPAPFLKDAGKVLDVFTHNGVFALVLTIAPFSGIIHRHEARLQGAVWQSIDQLETDEGFINAAGTAAGVVAHECGHEI
ncbi:MAG: hypothetical protein Q8M11_13330 [Sulfuritalea sp.]|nr:hypothetical protein [Sulfuritalea sp.]MDP1985149.1 hypothetical protein [Sulfuritalea sp.]